MLDMEIQTHAKQRPTEGRWHFKNGILGYLARVSASCKHCKDPPSLPTFPFLHCRYRHNISEHEHLVVPFLVTLLLIGKKFRCRYFFTRGSLSNMRAPVAGVSPSRQFHNMFELSLQLYYCAGGTKTRDKFLSRRHGTMEACRAWCGGRQHLPSLVIRRLGRNAAHLATVAGGMSPCFLCL